LKVSGWINPLCDMMDIIPDWQSIERVKKYLYKMLNLLNKYLIKVSYFILYTLSFFLYNIIVGVSEWSIIVTPVSFIRKGIYCAFGTSVNKHWPDGLAALSPKNKKER